METVEEYEVGEVKNGALVVHISGGHDEVYEITKIPLATASLVQDAKKDIFLNLNFECENLLTDLILTSDCLYLAFMAAVGTGELHASVSRRQMEFSDLCGLGVTTTNAMHQGSLAVLKRLTQAYSYLLHADERRALLNLGSCSCAASSMSTNSGKLAHGFRGLKDNTKRDSMLSSELQQQLTEEKASSNSFGLAELHADAARLALDNVFAPLSNGQNFWDGMTKFCKDLADSELTQQISDELWLSTPEERVQFYKSPDFVRQEIMYLANWTALSSVCAEYAEGSEDTRRSLLVHMKASPDKKEARDLIPKLKKQIQEELARITREDQDSRG